MRLSFSIPAKSAPKSSLKPEASSEFDPPVENNGATKQFVTEFDPSKSLASSNRTFIIPPIENEWSPHKHMMNIDLLPTLQSDGEGLLFEVATGTDDGDDKSMSYGLNLREQSHADGETGGAKIKTQQKHQSTEKMLLEKLRYDLQQLPEDRGFEEFKDVPVEGFGAALLAGYGWHEGRGIGKNAKEDVKVKEYHKRTNGEGLGFVASASNASSTSVNKDRQKENKRGKYIRTLGGGFSVGKQVRVIDGARDILGLKGEILERLDGDSVVVKLAESKEEVKLRIFDIADLGSKEEEIFLRKLNALQIDSNYSKGSDRENGILFESSDDDQGKDDRKRWLGNHIRVRIISKDLKGGTFYLKKGEVVDVVGPYTCDISMDDTKELVRGVDQDLLETALPRQGGPVLVLCGKHEGVYGNLVERDLDQEIGVVQDSDTHQLLMSNSKKLRSMLGIPAMLDIDTCGSCYQ